MPSEENEFSLSSLPKADWSEEDEVDYDILVDIVRLAISALTKLKHQERSNDNPDERLIQQFSERQTRLSKSLQELRIADAKTSDQLRIECLAIIKSASR